MVRIYNRTVAAMLLISRSAGVLATHNVRTLRTAYEETCQLTEGASSSKRFNDVCRCPRPRRLTAGLPIAGFDVSGGSVPPL
jgi:hypothetical protein